MHARILLVSVFAGGLALGAVAAGVSDAQPPAIPAAVPTAGPAPGSAEPVATEADIVAPTQSATPVAPAEATPMPSSIPAAPAPAAAAPDVPNPAVVAAPPPPTAPADTAQTSSEAGAAAKLLFSKKELPSIGKAMAIGYYPRGCLQGGVELPVTGPSWQVMRVSRNRNWGHPELVRFLERFAPLAKKATGWRGILVGDMAQPRGGPLPFGHKSHQIGLDVDIWFMPMPDHVLSKDEREKTSAINLVSTDWKHINPKTWTPAHVAFIRTAAQQPEVERVLVNAAIKKEMCRMQGANHPDWMDKVRPWYGHHDHIHVRLKCPADSPNCRRQEPVPDGAGCGKELDFWFSDKVLHPKKEAGKPSKPPRPLMMADLPPACKAVLDAPAKHVHQSSVN